MPYLRDSAACVGIALDAPKLAHQVYNISTGQPIGLQEMVTAMRQASPSAKFVEPIPHQDASIEYRQILDVSRMIKDLGFTPQYDIVSGLIDYIKWRRDFNVMD